ncbi:monovalent cation/H(+) antiporter subunit G, partial [Clavibacter phaseoli]
MLLILGGVLSVAAGVGLLRFPDPLARMHAAT